MTHLYKFLLAGCVALPLQTAQAEAPPFPISYSFFGAEISYVDSGNSRDKSSNIDNLANYPEYGVTLGHQFNPNFTLMGAFTYGDAETRTSDIDTDILRGSLAGRIHPGKFRFAGWRPFAGAGYSYTDIDVDGAPSSKTEDGLYLEGGLQRMVSERFVFEAGVRARTELEDGYVDGQAFAGVQFLFNQWYPQPPAVTTFERPEPVEPPKDSDGDGVMDNRDLCPNTPRGALVDSDGCAKKLTKEIKETLYVEFDLDGTEVKRQYFDEIEKLADLMTQYPTSRMLLEGHTDSSGSASYNQNLSQSRADSVMKVLVKEFDISSARISTTGMGESQPIADNATDEGRAQNRRVEAILTGKHTEIMKK
ncbi:OmpA family protein [Marinobacter sp.]|uniref:OmpA family protein n=1 Tax=Marinobacter sp. TaxID=50741 RepID=UPI0034A25A55